MPPLLTLDSVALAAPDGRVLVESLSVSLGRERIGLVGRNGVGKTSLLRLILGEIAPIRGAVRTTGRVSVLRQTLSPPAGATLADLVGASDALAVLDRIERGVATDTDLDAADWSLPQRLHTLLDQVGLRGLGLDRPAETLSGGQRTRAALAEVLLTDPDLILLDEPTNNLDAEGRAAVHNLLGGWEGGALVVSHDRTLLERMDGILELSSLGARFYGGGWTLYAERRAAETEAADRSLETAEREASRVARDAQITRERKARSDSVGRLARLKGDAPKILLNARAERAEATGARQTHLADRRRQAAEIALGAADARVERLKGLAPDMPASGLMAGRLVLAFEAVDFAWPEGASVLSGCTFSLTGPERVAVVGPNGSGKSTLLRLAAGDLDPTRGRVRRGAAAVRLDQQASLLEDDDSLVENFRRLNPGADDNAAHAALARFLFRSAAALKRAGELSGGEQLRAALACSMMRPEPPQLLILDEPTNHLDLASIEAIETALAAYDGALLIVSHDERFLKAAGVERHICL